MPQPIDLQTELGRLTAVERVQFVTQRAATMAQQRMAALEREEQVRIETRVAETPETDSGKVNPDERRRSDREGRGRRGEEEDRAARTLYDEHEHAKVLDDPEEHHLNVSA